MVWGATVRERLLTQHFLQRFLENDLLSPDADHHDAIAMVCGGLLTLGLFLSVFISLKFLFMGPLILAFLFVINLMTSPGHWWVQWAALGIGIAWVISLMRVIRAVIIAGGLAALGAYFLNKQQPR